MKHRAMLVPMHSSQWLMALPGDRAWSQEFKPSKQIEAVVHTGPGGGSDLLARAIAEMLQKEKLISQRMQVVNKSGGGQRRRDVLPGGKKRRDAHHRVFHRSLGDQSTDDYRGERLP